MIQLIVSVLVASCIILLNEYLSRQKIIGQELSRKIPHAVIAITIAFWPLFVGMQLIAFLGLVFVAAAWLIKQYNLFSSSRSVDRKSAGEYFFGFGIAATAMFNPAPWVFALAMFYVGVADTAAALVGKKFGKNKFKVFGQTKSVEGSVAFLVAAVFIALGFAIFNPASAVVLTLPLIIYLSVATAITEAISQYGIDNLLIPLLVVGILG